ncbi:MAG: DUF1848 family protein [Bacteroidota bacterium]
MPPRPVPIPVVLTASRRTDLVRWYPGAILRALAMRYPPERVHTIVLITKFPGAILAPELARALAAYEQVAAQVTITGWGGGFLEPRVPGPAEALADLPPLLAFLKDPRRLRVRLDPLLRLRDGRDNVAAACAVMRAAAALGVSDFVTSIVTPYPKLAPRFAAAGLALDPLAPEERRAMVGRLAETAKTLGVRLAGCCLPELPPASCVDGRLLQELHPRRLPCRLDHPPGQRAACGCTHAVDLGWYATHPCHSGCLYCYANPRL